MDEQMKVKKKRLTQKQRVFVREVKKGKTPTDAVRIAYPNVKREHASQMAYTNMNNAKILSHLTEFNDMVETAITGTIRDYMDSDDIKERALAVETAKWTHDKIHGKATRKVENTNLNINIETLLQNLK